MSEASGKEIYSRIRLIVLTALVTLIVAGAAAYLLGYIGTGAHRQAGMEKGEPQGKAAEKKVRYWRSPMDPTEIYNKPGKDKMGMELVPVYEGEAAAGPPGTVKIDPATTQNIGVKTAPVQRKKLSREIRTVGRIAYDEKKMRQISLKIGGWVERQNINFVGQEVQKGERLLEIYSPDLVSTQQEYLVALQYKNRLAQSPQTGLAETAERLLQSTETRLRNWNITDAQIKALRERGEITRTTVLHAPFRGIITERFVLEGGYVQPGQNLYSLADLSTVWVKADVYEYEAPWLRPDQEADMTLSYNPGATFRGRIKFIYPYVKNETRTLQVRMEFPNSGDFRLKPDMWANVTLKSPIAREGLAVPIQSVIRSGKRNVAIVALGGGYFEPRDVLLGPQAGDDFQVLSGLKEGELVVTSAQFLINSESNLQAALSKMLAPKGESPAGQAPQKQPMPSMKMPEQKEGHAGHGQQPSAGSTMKMPGQTPSGHEQHGQSPGKE